MKNKNLLIVIFFACYLGFMPFGLSAQTPTWVWAKSDTVISVVQSMALDPAGNIYIAGSSIYKCDNNGNIIWKKNFPNTGSHSDFASSITVDVFGNIIAAGWYYSRTITFDSTTILNTDTTETSSDLFVVKYDSSGNTIWAKSFGGMHIDKIQTITSDHYGNIYIAGTFEGLDIVFGTDTIAGGFSADDLFLTKCDSAGNVLWAREFVGSGLNDIPNCITTDNNGNVYMAGYFDGDSIRFGSTRLLNNGWYNFLVVKYDSAGTPIWAKTAGLNPLDISINIAYSLVTDSSDNVYVTGTFRDVRIILGNDSLLNCNAADFSIFIVKYDSTGNELWANRVCGVSTATSISLDAYGNFYLTGTCNSQIVTFGNVIMWNLIGPDLFVVKYDSSGSALWATIVPAISAFDIANSIRIDPFGGIIITGSYVPPSIVFGSDTLFSTNGGRMFIAKLDAPSYLKNLENDHGNVAYPNPSTGQITIRNNNDILSLEIYNLIGEKILQSVNSDFKSDINFSLPKGIYFYRVRDKMQFVSSGKLIVE